MEEVGEAEEEEEEKSKSTQREREREREVVIGGIPPLLNSTNV